MSMSRSINESAGIGGANARSQVMERGARGECPL